MTQLGLCTSCSEELSDPLSQCFEPAVLWPGARAVGQDRVGESRTLCLVCTEDDVALPVVCEPFSDLRHESA